MNSEQAKTSLKRLISEKSVFFITPSDLDYIRNHQEIKLIRNHCNHLSVVAGSDNSQIAPTGFIKLLKTILYAVKQLRKTTYDLVFIGGIPQAILPFLLPFIKKETIVIDFFISIYDTLVHDRRKIPANSLLAGVLKRIDQFTIKRAHAVITDTRAHGRYFSQTFGLCPSKTIVLYLNADDRIYFPKQPPRPAHLQNKFMVFFFGAMNPLQGAEIILQCAKLMSDHPQIIFSIVGPVQKLRPDIRKNIALPNVYIVSQWMDQQGISQHIAMSDLCLAGHFNSEIEKASRVIPGKAYIYLAMDKKIILGDNAANRELFTGEDRRIDFVEMGNAQALQKVIIKNYNQSKQNR